MREYRPHTFQKLAACTCDRCQRRLTAEETGEWQERLSLDHSCGFDSVFGDGCTISLDLCQHCVRDVLGQWLRVTQPELRQDVTESSGRCGTLAAMLTSMPNAGEDTDFARHPRLERFAAFGADFMAEGRSEHEWNKEGKQRAGIRLKGITRKPAKAVSVEDMDIPIAKGAGKSKHAKSKKKP